MAWWPFIRARPAAWGLSQGHRPAICRSAAPLQEKITGNMAEFNSEQELLQALDSLDEFRPPQQ
jgi:hypothetical protein